MSSSSVAPRKVAFAGAIRHADEWPSIEWQSEPTKYWFSTLAENISFRALVDLAKLRWRIERDYQELKQEVGLGAL
jgi:SRSO17 transposase